VKSIVETMRTHATVSSSSRGCSSSVLLLRLLLLLLVCCCHHLLPGTAVAAFSVPPSRLVSIPPPAARQQQPQLGLAWRRWSSSSSFLSTGLQLRATTVRERRAGKHHHRHKNNETGTAAAVSAAAPLAEAAAAIGKRTANEGTGRAAVILNTNARGVQPHVIEAARSVFGESAVFVTETADQAERAARAILQARYSAVIPVGGDGTLTATLQALCDAQQQQHDDNDARDVRSDAAAARRIPYSAEQMAQQIRALPAIAYVPLGTGNGVGSVVGCPIPKPRRSPFLWFGFGLRRKRRARQQERFVEVFQQIRDCCEQQQPQMNIVELPMIRVEHDDHHHRAADLCFFGGGECTFFTMGCLGLVHVFDFFVALLLVVRLHFAS
jgi:Diacylglycerol kinase catalytic domain